MFFIRFAVWVISIHALREEGDQKTSREIRHISYFYPRPPRGGRPGIATFGNQSSVFLSTPSARRATCVDSGEVCA